MGQVASKHGTECQGQVHGGKKKAGGARVGTNVDEVQRHDFDESTYAGEGDEVADAQRKELPCAHCAYCKHFCQKAERDPATNYVFVIDEINRANIAKVFGELITLLEDDKRIEPSGEDANAGLRVRPPYSKTSFGIPNNLYVIGTMNTADRSIALLDVALRRRFAFMEMMPDASILDRQRVSGINLSSLLTALNETVTLLQDKDHQIGHSYFVNIKTLDELHFVWYHRIIPLLEEYFYNDGERLLAVLGPCFVKQVELHGRERLNSGYLQGNQNAYNIQRLQGEEFAAALRPLSEART